ncbi:MAG: hypothetical protein BWY20_00277 [Spirochaetes bacterium ADurb.Bin215]|nr:MAG: hypothetical protein BWY20_00277 [Spirochaetes bacterium ADurb.Bin215]
MHHERGICRCRDAACGEVRNRQLAEFSCFKHEIVWSLQLFRCGHQFRFVHVLYAADICHELAHVAHCFNYVSCTGFALGTHHGRAFADAAEGFAKIPASANKGHLELVLVDMIGLVRRGEHFAFVDKVDGKRFKNLSFHKMTDTTFCHDRNGNAFLNFLDHFRIGHAGYSAIPADIRGDPFEGHNGRCSGVFSDLCLVGIGDIHYHAALEHFRQSDFYLECVIGIHEVLLLF